MRTYLVDALAPVVGHEAAVVIAPTWFTMVALAAIVSGWMMLRAARQSGHDERAIAIAIALVYVGGVAGGIVGPALIDALGHWLATGRFRLRWAGMTSFAGMIGAVAAAGLYLRHRRLPLGPLADLAAAPFGIALALSRTGCLIAGCDYGKVTSLPWAVRFPQHSSAWRDHVASGWLSSSRTESLPVHPTQLYEALLGVALCAGALWLRRTAWARARSGRVMLATMATYAIGRFAIETLRGDLGRGFLTALSTGQVASVALLLGCAALLWRARPLAPVAAAAVLLIVSPAQAQSQQPIDPYSNPAPATPPPSAPVPAPSPVPAPPATVAPAPAPTPAASAGRRWDFQAAIGASSSINRREEQIPALTGGTLSATLFVQPTLGVGVDIDSMVSGVAAHRAFLFGAHLETPLRPEVTLSVRGGIGFTLVDFDDPAFRDVLTGGMRVQASGSWWLNPRWALFASPLALDVITHTDIGGAIVSYQFRLGLTYRLH